MLSDNNTKINDIIPHDVVDVHGSFGRIYADDKGFSNREWSSIPPIAWEMRGITLKELNQLLEEALKSLLLECDFQLLNLKQKQVVSILFSGYRCTEWVSINEDEEKKVIHDCTDLAVKNWLTEKNQEYWNRLNWQAITKTFLKHSEEWIKEEMEWANSIGVSLRENWEYKKPQAQWSYMGHGYAGAMWAIRHLEVKD